MQVDKKIKDYGEIKVTPEERNRIVANSPKTLSLNPTQQGWSAQEIRRKMYEATCGVEGSVLALLEEKLGLIFDFIGDYQIEDNYKSLLIEKIFTKYNVVDILMTHVEFESYNYALLDKDNIVVVLKDGNNNDLTTFHIWNGIVFEKLYELYHQEFLVAMHEQIEANKEQIALNVENIETNRLEIETKLNKDFGSYAIISELGDVDLFALNVNGEPKTITGSTLKAILKSGSNNLFIGEFLSKEALDAIVGAPGARAIVNIPDTETEVFPPQNYVWDSETSKWEYVGVVSGVYVTVEVFNALSQQVGTLQNKVVQIDNKLNTKVDKDLQVANKVVVTGVDGIVTTSDETYASIIKAISIEVLE